MTSGRSYLRRARKRGPPSRRAGSLGTYDARRGALADAPPRRGRALDPPRAELNPNFALAHALFGMPLAIQRAREEAAASAQHALRLSPSDPLVSVCALYAMVGAHFAAGHYADCAARAGHSRYPPRPWPFTTFSSRRRRCRGIGQRRAAALTSLLRLEPDFSLKWLSEKMA